MGLMTLAAEEGTKLIIHADGTDAEPAAAALAALFTEHFLEGY
jgi:phosphotransferase system HPr-like phosphotransfer protein